MTLWLERTLNISNGAIEAVKILAMYFCAGVAFMAAAQYVHDKYRDTSHWAEYYDVQPTREVYPIGYAPTFVSHSVWYKDIRVAWPDVLHCRMLDGPEKGRTIIYRLSSDTPVREMFYEMVKPRVSGFYDELGALVDGSTDGVWSWGGQLPRYRSECVLEPIPILNPSPLVYRLIDVPKTEKFEFQ